MRARNATPSAMRFSQASADVIDGSRPRSCLNFKARLASSRASSIGEVDALGGDHGRDLLQALLAHGLGEDGIGFAERIDPVDQVDVQFAHIHRVLADAIDQGGVRALVVAFALRREAICLAFWVRFSAATACWRTAS